MAKRNEAARLAGVLLAALLTKPAAALADPLDAPPAGTVALVVAGQSNALGQADVDPQDAAPIPGVRVMRRSGAVLESAEPLGGAGYGYGRALARAYIARHPEVPELWLLECAVSGTAIAAWRAGSGEPYDVCRALVGQARNYGVRVAAVTWLQGEADAKAGAGTPNYDAQLCGVIAAFRADVGAPIPFVAGEIGRFLKGGAYPYRARIVAQTKAVLKKAPSCAYATSEGLTDRGDALHYDRASQDLMGARLDAALADLE